jgi:hypothetical protein
MPTTLPAPHSPLVLRDLEGHVWQSRLEALEDDTLTVARPFDLPLEDSPAPGARLEVSWTADDAAYSMPAGLVETIREGRVGLWVVSRQGETTRAQRRAHFRLALDGSVALALADGSLGEVRGGHLVDVSEAGLRVRVTPAEAEPYVPGAEVAAVFEVRQERFEVQGSVLRTTPSQRSNGDPATDVVVVLELSEPQARDLRRVLMSEQVQRRRLSRT